MWVVELAIQLAPLFLAGLAILVYRWVSTIRDVQHGVDLRIQSLEIQQQATCKQCDERGQWMQDLSNTLGKMAISLATIETRMGKLENGLPSSRSKER